MNDFVKAYDYLSRLESDGDYDPETYLEVEAAAHYCERFELDAADFASWGPTASDRFLGYYDSAERFYADLVKLTGDPVPSDYAWQSGGFYFAR